MDKAKNSVLVVDDENFGVMALTHILSPEYTVYAAKSGLSAIKTAQKHLPDVILLDILMPDMDGYDTIAALKQSDKTRDIPVIFISGLSHEDDEAKGLALGAADYITKPFSSPVVQLRVKNQIRLINQMRRLVEKEASEHRCRAKTDFLLHMSHEMLTPMNVIMGLSELLAMPDGFGNARQYAREINGAAQRLHAIIHGLLNLAGRDDGAFALVESEFSIDSLLGDILGGITAQAAKKRQNFTRQFDSSIPAGLIGDGGRLAQVVAHLLSNAVKFTPEGGEIHFSVRKTHEENDAAVLRFDVIDNGIGIARERRSAIFNAFEQVDSGVSRQHGGAGLGLALSKRIIEGMGGRIWVESEADRGARFAFTCPFRKS